MAWITRIRIEGKIERKGGWGRLRTPLMKLIIKDRGLRLNMKYNLKVIYYIILNL